MEKLNEHIEFLEMTESEPQLLVWLLELRRHRENNWQQRGEAAEALNTHLELAVRKAEGVSESLRRRAEDAENKLLFTRPAPAVSLAELVQGEMSFEDALQECREMPGVVAKSFQAGANWRRLQILRNIEEAGKK